MKRLFASVVAMAMVLSMMTACSSNGDGSSSVPGSSASGSSAASASNSADGGAITIGLLANTSGDNAQYGNAVKNGAMLYIDKVNAEGGVGGKQIEVIAYDEKGEPTEAMTAFNRLVDDGVTAVIGSVLTTPTIAVADLAYDINMPMISASATAAGVTMLDPDDESKGIRTNVFRSCFIDPFQGEKMAQYAYEKLGARTAAVIFETGNDYSEGLKNAFVEKFKELGGSTVSEQAYATGDVDFKAQMTAVAGQNPDVVFSPNYYEDDGMIVTQARAVGVKGTFLGGDGWAGVKGYASAADLENSVYCSGYGMGANPEFEKAYEEKYGDTITGMFEPLGYDAAMILVNAIAKAEEQGLTAGTDEYKQAVVDAMSATDGLQGLTGTFAFDEYNNPIKSASMIKLTNGEEVFSELY